MQNESEKKEFEIVSGYKYKGGHHNYGFIEDLSEEIDSNYYKVYKLKINGRLMYEEYFSEEDALKGKEKYDKESKRDALIKLVDELVDKKNYYRILMRQREQLYKGLVQIFKTNGKCEKIEYSPSHEYIKKLAKAPLFENLSYPLVVKAAKEMCLTENNKIRNEYMDIKKRLSRANSELRKIREELYKK